MLLNAGILSHITISSQVTIARQNLYQSIRIKHMLGQVNNEGRFDPKERHEIGTRVQRPF